MVGRTIDDIYPKRLEKNIGNVMFEVRNLSAEDRATGRQILKDVSFNVRAGEIVGLQGLMGAGRTECALAVFGNPYKYKITSGDVWLDGEPVHFRPSRRASRMSPKTVRVTAWYSSRT